MIRQVSLYASAAGIALVIHYGCLIVAVEKFGLPATVFSGVGFLLGAAAQYTINFFLTFTSTARHQTAILRYLINLLLSFTVNVALMYLLVDRFGFYYLASQVAVTAGLFLGNFLLGKHWVFRDER